MRLFRKTHNCLFVEEEQYNWAAPRSSANKVVLMLSVAVVACGLLFSVL